MNDSPSIGFRVAAVLLTILLAPVAGWGAFANIENFDALSVGEIDGQNGWSATTGLGNVAADPDEPTNQFLELTPVPGTLARYAARASGNRADAVPAFSFRGPTESFVRYVPLKFPEGIR